MSANDNFSLHDDEELSLHDNASLDGSDHEVGSDSEWELKKMSQQKNTTALMAVPKDLLRTFSWQDDAKEIWAAHQGHDIQKTSSSKPYRCNVAFLSQAKPLPTSISLVIVSTKCDDVVLIHEDLDLIDDLDLEEKGYKLAQIDQLGLSKLQYEELNSCSNAFTVNNEDMDTESNDEVEYKGVPHPLSGDYTPREQEDIDDSLYEYGKYGPQPQSPSPTVSNASSIVFSICPSNDSDGELGANGINRMEKELGAGYSFERKPCFVCGSLCHLIKDCDYYGKKMARELLLRANGGSWLVLGRYTGARLTLTGVNKAN
ncbi:hypothetical protein Tco_0123526 [Tanacetum coccineum]